MKELVKWGTIVLFLAVGLWIIWRNILDMFPVFVTWVIGGLLIVTGFYIAYKELK